jgi:3-oxoacyl-[acyl-carrier-protein] synthase-3
MRYDSIHICGLGVDLGHPESVDTALAGGQYSPAAARRSGQRAALAAPAPLEQMPPPRMAVRAAQRALQQATDRIARPVIPESVLYGHVHYQGHDFWSPSCYIRDQLGIPAGPGITQTIGAMSNSAIAGLATAADRLTLGHDQAVLVAAGDRFGDVGFPRWSTDYGIVYGDGAAAAVLTREPGIAQVVAIADFSDGSMEAAQRGHSPFRPASLAATCPLAVDRRKSEWLASTPRSVAVARTAAGTTDVVKRALSDAHLDLDDLAYLCAPHYGRHLTQTQILRPLGITEDRTATQLGLDLGHLGAADQLVALHHLLTTHAVRPGDHIMLLGAGIGMTWTATILTITAIPSD